MDVGRLASRRKLMLHVDIHPRLVVAYRGQGSIAVLARVIELRNIEANWLPAGGRYRPRRPCCARRSACRRVMSDMPGVMPMVMPVVSNFVMVAYHVAIDLFGRGRCGGRFRYGRSDSGQGKATGHQRGQQQGQFVHDLLQATERLQRRRGNEAR